MLVGAFVLILAGAFIWGILWISAGGTPRSIDRYVVYMTDSVSGLNVDAPLSYRGVNVGKVEQISIDEKNPQLIRLLLQVRQGTPISEDTVATLEYQGLTGIASVNLTGGKAGAPPPKVLPGEDYPIIQSRPSIFASLDTSLEGLMASLTETSTSLNAMLSENNRTNLARSLESVATLSENFARQSSHLETLIAHLETTLANTSTASENFPRLVSEFTRSAESITRMADEIRGIGEKLSAASAGIEKVVDDSGDSVVDFARTTLPEISLMVNELRLASENLRRMSEALERDPSLLMYGEPEPEPGPGE
jgi:phospholipid/cholesterol/gamma-HCH transport system substrate-binding protein